MTGASGSEDMKNQYERLPIHTVEAPRSRVNAGILWITVDSAPGAPQIPC